MRYPDIVSQTAGESPDTRFDTKLMYPDQRVQSVMLSDRNVPEGTMPSSGRLFHFQDGIQLARTVAVGGAHGLVSATPLDVETMSRNLNRSLDNNLVTDTNIDLREGYGEPYNDLDTPAGRQAAISGMTSLPVVAKDPKARKKNAVVRGLSEGDEGDAYTDPTVRPRGR